MLSRGRVPREEGGIGWKDILGSQWKAMVTDKLWRETEKSPG